MRNINAINEKMLWVPLFAFALGFGLPMVLVDFVEDGWQDRIFFGIISSMIVFTYAIFKKLGNKYPQIRIWSENSILGMSVTIFFVGLVASALSTLFAILPLPVWLHFSIGILLSLYALSIMVSKLV